MNENTGKAGFLHYAKNADVLLAGGLIGILVLMIVPLPSFMVDIFLTVSIAGSIVLLLTATYAQRPLDFSVFPSLLLTVTLFRLALNVASTRLVLLHGPEQGTGAAGVIIRSFGEFVVGGNYAVGLVVFVILVIINFVVITKGAGRVAEVSARFTLDAMPGKQMAIDADLNAGVINEQEARKRRASVSQEADFYGAMDGASKFVRGDAIAGILVVVVNIFGGIIIGTFQRAQRCAAIVPGLRRGAQLQGFVHIGQSFLGAPHIAQHGRAVEPQIGIAGLKLDGGAETFQRFFAPPRGAQHRRFQIMRFRRFGIECQRFFNRRQSFRPDGSGFCD